MEKNETERKFIRQCFCCKKDKEVSSICVTESDYIKRRNTNADVNVDTRFVCKDCNHLEKR